MATFLLALAAIAALAFILTGCKFTTPDFGLGYNTTTGMIGVSIGPMTIGHDPTNAPSTMPPSQK